MFDRNSSRAKSVFAKIREETPDVEVAEKALGSRRIIARNVLRMRVQRGYTQKQLAEALGVRQPRVAEIESARANLQVDTLDRLAKVFGVETASLLKGERPSRLMRAAPAPESMRSARDNTHPVWGATTVISTSVEMGTGALKPLASRNV